MHYSSYTHPVAYSCFEVVEYELRVDLAHLSQILDIVSQLDVVEGEVGGGAVGHVAHHHLVGLATGRERRTLKKDTKKYTFSKYKIMQGILYNL